MRELNYTNLESFIKHEIIKGAKKIRGKHSPISEVVKNSSQSLRVEKIYDLGKIENNHFLLIVRNYTKKPKLRYFLAVSIANNSSDLLVQLARDYVIKNDLKLIQYSIFPKTLRIQLLLLKELEVIEDFTNSINKLKICRKDFRSKLLKIKNLLENE
ncbi:MAG: hypothetical protein ACFE9C_02235 [Candidatus Hodarchaeota archaeon]